MHTVVDTAELQRLYTDHVAWLARTWAQALEDTGHDAVVVHGGTPKQKSVYDDQYFPLRATPHFQHWLPYVAPHAAVLVQPGQQPRLFRPTDHGFWEAPPTTETDHFWSAFHVVDVPDQAQMKALLPHGKRLAFLGEDRAVAQAWGFDDARTSPPELLKRLDALRTRKSAYERLCLLEANRRACVGHAAVLAAFRTGEHSELQLHLMYLEATQQDDPETPYKNIVALGEHAATLHHVGYGKQSSRAQSLLLDAGATYQGYDSDITRTAVKGQGAAATVFGDLIARLEVLQQEVCRKVAVGLPYEQLHNQSHELLAPIVRELGIIRASDDELVASGATRKLLPHGLGHSLGLQTHDVGCANIKPEPRNPFLRNTAKIELGQCFTIEPGCYFIPSLLEELRATSVGDRVDWALVAELKKLGGVRIEDDLVVLDAGVDNLTRRFLPG